MFHQARLILFAACTAALCGCGAQPVTGGTPGMLRAAGQPLGDIQVTVHEAADGGWRQVGFGVTNADGSFALVNPGAAGELWLPPGAYRCTLESVGAPVAIPQEYALPETTPLAIERSSEEESLNLEIPAVPTLP